MQVKVVLAGPRGKMGKEAIKMITNVPEFELVACIDRKNTAETRKEIGVDVPVYEDLDQCLTEIKANVFVDLTIPEIGYRHTKTALKHNVRPVVGTSGFTNEQLDELSRIAEDQKCGCIIAPNFAIGAVLMMQFSKMAAKYMTDVEIIEKHHDQKLDAPSGTAQKTIELIKENRQPKQQGNPNEVETLAGARGGEVDGIRVHSVRLPGLVAHQEVIFGGVGQTLTIAHDSLNRESFMDGIKLAIEEALKLEELVYGLENILQFN